MDRHEGVERRPRDSRWMQGHAGRSRRDLARPAGVSNRRSAGSGPAIERPIVPEQQTQHREFVVRQETDLQHKEGCTEEHKCPENHRPPQPSADQDARQERDVPGDHDPHRQNAERDRHGIGRDQLAKERVMPRQVRAGHDLEDNFATQPERLRNMQRHRVETEHAVGEQAKELRADQPVQGRAPEEIVDPADDARPAAASCQDDGIERQPGARRSECKDEHQHQKHIGAESVGSERVVQQHHVGEQEQERRDRRHQADREHDPEQQHDRADELRPKAPGRVEEKRRRPGRPHEEYEAYENTEQIDSDFIACDGHAKQAAGNKKSSASPQVALDARATPRPIGHR